MADPALSLGSPRDEARAHRLALLAATLGAGRPFPHEPRLRQIEAHILVRNALAIEAAAIHAVHTHTPPTT